MKRVTLQSAGGTAVFGQGGLILHRLQIGAPALRAGQPGARTVELEAVFSLSADQNGLHLTPVMLTAGEKAFSLSGLPQNVFSAVDTGLNALLNSAGVRFSSAEFTEDGLLLK